MKYALFLLSCLAVASFSGCGSSPPANSNIDTVLEPGVTQPPPPDANTVVGNNPRDPKNRKPREVHPAGPSAAPSDAKPAPENSEMSAMMNEDGSITEIRTFKGHQRIARVEATWTNPLLKNVKVFLRDGKVREAQTDKLPKLNEAPTELILSVVGVR